MPSASSKTATVNLSNALPGSDVFFVVSASGNNGTLRLGSNIYASADSSGNMPITASKVYVFHFVCILNPSGVASLYEVTRADAGSIAGTVLPIGESIV